jgi:hypothetical protein
MLCGIMYDLSTVRAAEGAAVTTPVGRRRRADLNIRP